MTTKGLINDGTRKSETTFEIRNNNQQMRQLYNISRCSNSSGISEISNFSSEGHFMEHHIQKPIWHSKNYELEKKRNSAKKSMSFLDDDANSFKSLSLHSS